MKILLLDLAAKAIHKTLAPWCIKAYCDTHVPDVEIFVQAQVIHDRPYDMLAEIYRAQPDVVGISCYIWNIAQVKKLSENIKQILPHCVIVLGGPEVSFETKAEDHPAADYIVQGKGEETFADFLLRLQAGTPPSKGILPTIDHISFADLPSPYTTEYFHSFATERMEHIENQLVYYESTRGCPFSCSYCLSSACTKLEELPLERVFAEIDQFLAHGATRIKFVDRTFNADPQRAWEILRHIQQKETGANFHFEVAADLFDDALLEIIKAMPKGRVQFEIGIQSLNEATLAEINRPMQADVVQKNVRTLLSFGNCHIHLDLIAGLPFETPDSFAKGIRACLALRPHMLQLGFLKLLKGTALRKKHNKYAYVFDHHAPYELFSNKDMSFADMTALKAFEETIDRFYNSGVFTHTIAFASEHVFADGHAFFQKLTDFCTGGQAKIAPKQAYTILLSFLSDHMERAHLEHLIKLDCFTHHTKAVLPDEIAIYRDKEAEKEYKRNHPNTKNVRIEYFPYDDKQRIFFYDTRDELTKAYRVETV